MSSAVVEEWLGAIFAHGEVCSSIGQWGHETKFKSKGAAATSHTIECRACKWSYRIHAQWIAEASITPALEPFMAHGALVPDFLMRLQSAVWRARIKPRPTAWTVILTGVLDA